MKYSQQQIADLWKQAGGNAAAVPMAVAIALAESGGDSQATNNNTNGTVDRGLWQINSIHGSLSTYDPMANARAAVQLSNNGGTWRPWCTAWSSGRCSGTYLGAGAPYKKYLSSTFGSINDTAPTATPVQAPAISPKCAWKIDVPSIGPIGGGQACLLSKVAVRGLIATTLMSAALVAGLAGVVLLVVYGFKESPAGQVVAKAAKAVPGGGKLLQ